MREFVNVIPMMLREYNILLGGEYEKYNEITEYFFNELRKCKTNLVFFAGIQINDNVNEKWQERMNQHHKKIKILYSVYDKLNRNHSESLYIGRDNK